MNDWFTYEQTDIEKKEAAKAETRKPTSTKNEPRRPLDPKPSTGTVTVNGTEYTMTAEGIVKVNDEIVPIDYILENKDRVIVLTDDLAYGNRKDLIDRANTEYAKKKIKGFSKN